MIDDADVRSFVYRSALTTGSVPLAKSIARQFAQSEHDVRESFARLADAHMLVLQPGGDEILMAMPFSAVPTPFAVSSGSLTAFGNCIWDSLGILAMLGRDGRVDASCGCCGTAMTLHVEDGELRERDGVSHFGVPAIRWWDDIAFT